MKVVPVGYNFNVSAFCKLRSGHVSKDLHRFALLHGEWWFGSSISRLLSRSGVIEIVSRGASRARPVAPELILESGITSQANTKWHKMRLSLSVSHGQPSLASKSPTTSNKMHPILIKPIQGSGNQIRRRLVFL